MTNKQLQFAIAAKLDLCTCLEVMLRSAADDAAGMWCAKCQKVIAPNYSNDIAAAAGAAIEVGVPLGVFINLEVNDVRIVNPHNSSQHGNLYDHDNTLAGIARAICLAILEDDKSKE